MRIIAMAAGTRRVIEFNATYSESWSVASKRPSAHAGVAQPILATDISSAKFLLKNSLTSSDESAAVTKTLSSGITKIDGKVTVTLNPADTKELEGSYLGTLRLYLTDGGVVDFEDTSYTDTPYLQISITQGSVESIT
jgi:hypothetical protein